MAVLRGGGSSDIQDITRSRDVSIEAFPFAVGRHTRWINPWAPAVGASDGWDGALELTAIHPTSQINRTRRVVVEASRDVCRSVQEVIIWVVVCAEVEALVVENPPLGIDAIGPSCWDVEGVGGVKGHQAAIGVVG